MYLGSLVYSFMPRFLPYHATAIGKQWNELDHHLQILIISALNACGALLLGCTIAITVLLAIPFRRGELWASWAITGLGCFSLLSVIRAAVHVDLYTPANPPWPALLVIIALFIAGLVCQLAHTKNTKTQSQN